MLQNAYLDAKIGFDTAENEPSKVRGFLVGVGGGHPKNALDNSMKKPGCRQATVAEI